MKLYFTPASCSLATQIALHEAGIGYDGIRVDLKTHQTADGKDFYAINPKGYVPAVELDNGELLTEGTAILAYIADRAPDSGLAPPAGTPERVRFNEWIGYVNSEVHKTMGSLFDGEMPPAYQDVQRQRIVKKLAWLDGVLAQRPYLMGERFSAVDGYLYVVLNWGQWVGVDVGAHSHLKAFQERIAARPAVMAARKAAGL